MNCILFGGSGEVGGAVVRELLRSDKRMIEVEVNMVGKYARGCKAAGIEIFKPGMIVGNAHTPKWLTVITGLIPDSVGWGNIRQEEVAQAFVAHMEKGVAIQNKSAVSYGNKEMKMLINEKDYSH